MDTRVLIILGMHRSGTSLLSRRLHESGLHLGHRRLGKSWSNPGGHFEDRDFIDLHNAILSANGLTHRITSDVRFDINAGHRMRATSLVKARSAFRQWGWKDPRTCLFIPFWHEVLKDPCHIIIVRNYRDVIESYLHREYIVHRSRYSRFDLWRGKYNFDETEQARIVAEAAGMWLTYNQMIYNKVIEAGRPYALVHFESFVEKQNLPMSILEDWNFELRVRPPKRKGNRRVVKVARFDVQLDASLENACAALYKVLTGVRPTGPE